jgi:phosphoglycerate dehydrogenase-like enzyme
MKVLYDAPLPDESIAEIRERFPGIVLVPSPLAPLRDLVAEADVFYTQSADFEPADAPRLRWVQTNSASTQALWNRPVMRTGIPICNASGAYSVAVAECALGMLLALTRRITRGVAFQREHRWPADDAYEPWAGVDLHGLTMGIVGYGSIGRQIARLAHSFGMKVLACKRRPENRRDDSYLLPDSGDPVGAIPAAWYGRDQLGAMFADSDVVMVTLPEIPTTIGLIGARELAALPRHTWLVNVGRGPVIDEPALLQTLQEGKIAGAGLDVFVREPLPAESLFWDLPNVLIMPHVASWTTFQAQRAAGVLIENLRRDLAGERLVNLIDKQFLY